jgi:hypothetical protein
MDLQSPGLREENKQRIWLESKQDMRRRGEKSPDEGDALALTFAIPVKAKTAVKRSNLTSGDWNWS